MVSRQVAEFCDKVRFNKFGGAAEMVKNGVESIAEASRSCLVNNTSDFAKVMESDLDSILEVIPSIAPMTNLLHEFMSSIEKVRKEDLRIDLAKEEVAKTLENYLDRQSRALEKIGLIGSQMIKDNSTIATFSTSGSVMEIFKFAKKEGKKFKVLVTEARPANEGIRTMREIIEMGIPVDFGIDAILGYLIPTSSMFVVGADVINSTGDVLVKVGTYLGALVAREHNIPFFVAADTSKFDPMTLEGFPLKINDKGPDVVIDQKLPDIVNVMNPSFELIPARLITGYITELGIIHPGGVSSLMHQFNLSETLSNKLHKWVDKPVKH